MTDEVGELAGGEEPRDPPSLRAIWYLVSGALLWSVAVVVVGAVISKPYVLTTNAQGAIVSSGGTSSLVGFGILSLGISILVTQITARRAESRLLPVAWVISVALAVVSLVAIVKVGPILLPSAAACVVACEFARRRARDEE